MASIPHGTVILAQGTGKVVNGPPQIHDNNILPFPIGGSPQSFNQEEQTFTELNLSQPTQFRFKSPGVTQAMVKNPNSVLKDAIAGQNIKKTVVLQITTKNTPIKGGGTANTAFLQAAGNPPTGNAKAVEVDATFWIETVAEPRSPRQAPAAVHAARAAGLQRPTVAARDRGHASEAVGPSGQVGETNRLAIEPMPSTDAS